MVTSKEVYDDKSCNLYGKDVADTETTSLSVFIFWIFRWYQLAGHEYCCDKKK